MTTLQIQALLTYLGYDPGDVDGLPGKNTRRAVLEFQAQEGLATDGSPGPLTQAAMLDAVAAGRFREEDFPTPEETTGTFWDEIKYFKKQEFACKCGKYCDGYPAEIGMDMVKIADQIRTKIGKPITINSGLRCKTHNSNVGGVSNSQHLLGKAADLGCPSGCTPAQMASIAEEIMGDTGGIGTYSWGIHIDTRSTKSRWNG